MVKVAGVGPILGSCRFPTYAAALQIESSAPSECAIYGTTAIQWARLGSTQPVCGLQELFCLLSQDDEGREPERSKETNHNQPIPPNVILIGIHICYKFVAVFLAVATQSITKLVNEKDTDSVRQ